MQTESMPKSNSARKPQRRRYVVNPHFQWKYASWLIGVVFTASTLLATIMLYVLREQARATVLGQRMVDSGTDSWLLVGFGAAFAMLAAVTFGAWSFVLTRRICGPLCVVSRHLSDLRAGRFPVCRPLRKGDEFKEFYHEFTQTVDALRDRRQSELAAIERALANLTTGEAHATAGRLDELARELETLREAASGAAQSTPKRATTGATAPVTSK